MRSIYLSCLSPNILACLAEPQRVLKAVLLISLFAIVLGGNAKAQNEISEGQSAAPVEQADQNQTELSTQTLQETIVNPVDTSDAVLRKQLKLLVESIEESKLALQSIRQQIAESQSEAELASLIEREKEVVDELREHRRRFEQLATGAVDISMFERTVEEDFSWHDELKDIFRPLIMEVKKLTERPRQIEKLRSQREITDQQLNAARFARQQVEDTASKASTLEVQQSLAALKEKWQKRADNLERELTLIDFQLEERLNSEEGQGVSIARAFMNFITGRGFNILIAILVFIITFFIFRFLSAQVEKWISRGQDSDSRFIARITHVVLQVLTVLISVFALMMVLYMLGDWLILTLLLIILVGVAFALRNSLPRYVDEVRLLLNVGAVREGERVVYGGIPYNVSRINIYSDLVNPVLSGGRLRLPLKEITPLISRRWHSKEPWFPSKSGEWVILDDDTFGEIIMQTPELVQMGLVGGARKQYQTSDYLSNSPVNLSSGFGLFVTFGLDYGIQDIITSEAIEKIEAYLRSCIETSEFAEWNRNVGVEFQEAGASSLDLSLRFGFEGDAAPFYYKLKRLVQRSAVDACNEFGYVIPFQQLTVHLEK